MPIFSYRATTMDGSILEGVIDASDEKKALDILKNKGVIPLKITTPRTGVRRELRLRSQKGDILTFTTELSELLSAGLPLDRSLNILSDITGNREMKGIIQSILKSIREGSSFSDALLRHPKTFPSLYINMVRAGEAGGVLEVVLEKLNEYLESSKELKEHVVSSMVYPSILILTGGLSIIVLPTYVLPKFTVIFAELGKSLPLPTQVLLGFSNTLKSYWWVILPAFISLWLALKNYIKTETGRVQWDTLKLKIAGDLVKKLETARFCRTLGTLLKSGVPLLQALSNSKDVINNRVISSAIDAVSKGAKEGKGIAIPLSDSNVMPSLAISMIKVGEETGQLDNMLLKVAVTYEKSIRVAIKRFINIIEPAMI
ncbi:MAG: type II secretion system F family protein, partial [Nitrospirota bacterium]